MKKERLHHKYSNVRELVEQQQYVFDTPWNKSMPSEEKIKEIEDGIQPSYIETIRDPIQIQKRAYKLATSARAEILILCSTANVLYRQAKFGVIQQLEELATRYTLKIRILTPLNDSIKQLAQELRKYADIRYIPEELQIKISIAIIDRKSSLVGEMKDDTKNSSYEAMAFCNSASTYHLKCQFLKRYGNKVECTKNPRISCTLQKQSWIG
jgi:two-component system, OmpR family, sensor histidine kinase VicK